MEIEIEIATMPALKWNKTKREMKTNVCMGRKQKGVESVLIDLIGNNWINCTVEKMESLFTSWNMKPYGQIMLYNSVSSVDNQTTLTIPTIPETMPHTNIHLYTACAF